MAYTTNTSRVLDNTSVAQRLIQLRAGLSTRLANYRTYRATLAQLSALSDRELGDVGVTRGMIRTVASDATYKA